jgi:molybdopterin-guanine dinucleotide biosynthesis protein A
VIEVDARYSGGPAHALIGALGDAGPVTDAGVVAVDMPFIGEALSALIDAWPACTADALVVRSGDGRAQWLCAIYRADALLGVAEKQNTDGLGMYQLVETLTVRFLDVPDAVITMDVDTVADLERAEREVHGR